MKFKVGDRVKTRKGLTVGKNYGDWVFCSSMEQWKGKIMTIREVRFDFYKVEENNWGWSEEMLELAEYTYEDLKKAPIGTKITFENGSVLVKTREGRFENYIDHTYIEYLKKLEDNSHGKIIKIEKPEYKTVYEYKLEVLDEVEKRYLRGFIKPFIDDVETIRKLYSPVKDKEYIQIRYKDDRPTCLPYFKKNTMYKGMKENRHYTLEELGL